MNADADAVDVDADTDDEAGPGDRDGDDDLRALARARQENTRLRARIAEMERAAQQAMSMRDAFLDSAAHDLRTPLHVLTLHLSSLTEAHGVEHVPDALKKRVAAMDRQVKHLVRLTDRLVDVTLLGEGRLPLQRRPVDLVEVARSSVGRLEDSLRWAGCDVNFDAPGSLVAEVDDVRIDEVVGNLLMNAAKYAPGSPVLVAVDKDHDSHGHARIAVIDRGPGVPPQLRTRIFEKFNRGLGAAGTSGLGLGLWIARQIVEAHGGTICVKDGPMGGAAFVVAIPVSA